MVGYLVASVMVASIQKFISSSFSWVRKITPVRLSPSPCSFNLSGCITSSLGLELLLSIPTVHCRFYIFFVQAIQEDQVINVYLST